MGFFQEETDLSGDSRIHLNKFKPRDYQIPIFDAIENKGYRKILYVIPRRCLSGETHILLANGSTKLLKDISVGSQILSWNGMEFVPDIVRNVWKTGKKKTLKIQSKAYLPLTSSRDHLFATARLYSTTVYQWKKASELISATLLLNYAGTALGAIHNPDMAEFIGYMYCGGYISRYHRSKFINNNIFVIKRVEELIKKLFNYKAIWKATSNSFELNLPNGIRDNKKFKDEIAPLFSSSTQDFPNIQQRLLSCVWDFDEDSLGRFFAALISGSGDLRLNPKDKTAVRSEVEIHCRNSETYGWDIYWLLRKLGIVSQVQTDERNKDFKIRISERIDQRWILSNGPVYGKEIVQAKLCIDLMTNVKETKPIDGCFRSSSSTKASINEDLYDLETENNFNFVANGYVVHNSGKDLVAWNITIRQAIRRVGVYYYIFPTYSQGKKVIWDAVTNNGMTFIDYVPSQLIAAKNSQEMKITLSNGSLIQIIGSEKIDCFDEKTEILTEDGFKFFRDLNRTEKVATLNDGYLTYDNPTKYIESDYSGLMYRGNSKAIDFLVTPRHRFWVKSQKGIYKFKNVTDLSLSGDAIPSTSLWDGEERSEFAFPEISNSWTTGKGRIVEKLWNRKVPMEKFVALLGIFLAEGSTYKDYKTYRVIISQVKENIRSEIRDLLVECEIKACEDKGGFNIEDKQMYEYFSQFGLQHARFIPKEIKMLSVRYLKILFDWLVKGDGCLSNGSTSYYSTSKQLIDDVQELILKLGYSGTVTIKAKAGDKSWFKRDSSFSTYRHDLYAIKVRKSRLKRFSSSNKSYLSTENYTGKIYCVSVPSGVIKVRRNGKEMWSGNSIVGTNPVGCVFSEMALQDAMRNFGFLRPILLANDGWFICQSCVSPETLVIGVNGLQRIKNVSEARTEYSKLDKKMYGINGFNNATDFYYGGVTKTYKIKLSSGYALESTGVHPIWNGTEWVRTSNLKLGDPIPIQYGQDIWGLGLDISDFTYRSKALQHFKDNGTWCIENLKQDKDFFYLLGLIHADGCYTKAHVCVSNKKDPEIIEFLHNNHFVTEKDGIHHRHCSKELVVFLEYLGFKHGAKNKIFPDKLFECTKEQMKNFLSGVFDGDGTSSSNPKKRGYIKLTSVCHDFLKTVQVVLLNFGIASSILREEKGPTKKVKVHSTIYNLEIRGYFACKFYEDVSFRLPRKQKNWMHPPEKTTLESGNIYPVDPAKFSFNLPKWAVTNPYRISRRKLVELHGRYECPYIKDLLDKKFFYSPIVSIEESENEVFDFVIPETHSFFSNGFISHNTPRGRNGFYQLYQVAKQSPDWFCQHLTLHDTKHISEEEIQRDIAQGVMSKDLAAQEYFCSFMQGVEGSYYAKYMDKLSLMGQITIVPWESPFPVHTAWDLGMRDKTVIIFFQIIGQSIRIIDYYENDSQGLEFYAKHLDSKDYKYGKHFAPHDIKVRELGTGLSRIEKARQLGLNFITVPNLSIEDGIEAVRTTLPKVWFDEKKCKLLIKSLEDYRKEFDQKKKIYRDRPLHNYASHAADAMRMLALSLPNIQSVQSSPEALEKRYRDAVYGNESNFDTLFNRKF